MTSGQVEADKEFMSGKHDQLHLLVKVMPRRHSTMCFSNLKILV